MKPAATMAATSELRLDASHHEYLQRVTQRPSHQHCAFCWSVNAAFLVALHRLAPCLRALDAHRAAIVDTVLLLSGIALMVKAHILPFTEHGTWLTEKLFGVIIYIVLGFIALDYRRARSQQARLVAFPLALVVLYIIIKLATTKIPLLG